MSIGWCQAYCTSLGYRYSGIEYQIQCFCDLEINPTAQFYGRVNMSIGCDMTCPGDRSQLCGGSAYINVFKNEDPDFVPTNNTSGSAGQLLVPVAPFAQNYQGCASEGTSGRALNASAIERANMTLQTCAAYCAQQNTRFYGLEYYTQCFCGAGLASGSQFVDTSTDPRVSACNTRCAGDFSQICGGGGALSVYENTEYTPVVIVPAVGEYVTSGCLTDPDPTRRSLAADFYQDMDNMTVESCVAFCKGGGYRYAGYVLFRLYPPFFPSLFPHCPHIFSLCSFLLFSTAPLRVTAESHAKSGSTKRKNANSSSTILTSWLTP